MALRLILATPLQRINFVIGYEEKAEEIYMLNDWICLEGTSICNSRGCT
ncbi:hypothetical protein MtrunA17_Chr6g0461161 [Medicago truncatula]|uniref:Uncharacterized protein n=1 Tax=Medicago truncatula TaxID=3880 RepID=A0A396HC39_MEDTR|nr:hypothetical protein MtrunA17_Chr6g0461161 [Medicago truncatula]